MVKINCIFCSFRFNVLHGNVDNKNKATAGAKKEWERERGKWSDNNRKL